MDKARAPLAVFSHPGHELRLLHSLRVLDARCLYLTDASASTGQARLTLTDQTLEKAGTRPRLDIPALPDGEVYGALHRGDFTPFEKIASLLRDQISELKPTFLITDSAEGYNPAHDVCHFLCVQMASELGLDVFDVALDGDPADRGQGDTSSCLIYDLDDAALSRKLNLIRDYAEAAGPQLAGEALSLLQKYGDKAQGVEILRPAMSWSDYDQLYSAQTPFFETHGKRRVAEGKYKTALTYSDHLRPALLSILGRL